MSQLIQAAITGHSETAPGVYVIDFFAPDLARAARPGQFLHIRCGDGQDPLLRRPISIHAVDRQNGLVSIMFHVVGRGTALLAQRKEGYIDVMGPLGRGFAINQGYVNCKNKSIMVMGGGIGVAPLYFLLQELVLLDDARIIVLLGAKNAEQLLIHEKTKQLGLTTYVATDDSSAGYQGVVTDLISEELRQEIGFAYACGPVPMLKALCSLLNEIGVPGEVSVEERMACGVGACLSCVCRVKDAKGIENYRHACVDGPVFSVGEVVW